MHKCPPYSSYSFSFPSTHSLWGEHFDQGRFYFHQPPLKLGIFYSTLPFIFCNVEAQRITLGIFRIEGRIKLMHKSEFLLGKRVVRQQAGNIHKLITSSFYARYASMQDKSPKGNCNIWDYSSRHNWPHWIPRQCNLLTTLETACGGNRTKWFPLPALWLFNWNQGVPKSRTTSIRTVSFRTLGWPALTST